jgi:hypothetical protein
VEGLLGRAGRHEGKKEKKEKKRKVVGKPKLASLFLGQHKAHNSTPHHPPQN